MSKKKKNKKGRISDLLGTPQPEEDLKQLPINDKEGISSTILERRLKDRVIPLIDAGIKDKDAKNPPPDVCDAWYATAHVGKYVHMEQVIKDGSRYTTKRVQFEFSRMLQGYQDNLNDQGVNPAIERLSFATLNKISFINNIANPLRYINYFIEYFDDDDELMRAYFEVMFEIMLDELDLDPMAFIETVYAAFTTDSMIQKLIRMVEYNVDDNLVKKADRAYDESVQLTIEHLKAIMGVSCLHKFVIPLVSHYYNTRTRLLEDAHMSDKDLYYYLFTAFIPVFDEHYDICLYNKLYHTSTTRITKTNQEGAMWDRRKRIGTTPTSYTNDLMRDFVTDISQKAIFSKSAIVFIHVCMDKAIHNTLIQTDKYDYTEMTMEASDSVNETVSRWDRWQTDRSYHSQLDRIRLHVSVKDSIDRLGKKYGLDFKKMRSDKPKDIEATRDLREEYEYYRDNIPRPMHDTQVYFIRLYYAAAMGSAADTKIIQFPDMIKLIMIMKRDFAARNYIYLPFFISGKVKAAAAKTYNRKKIEKLIVNHPLYDDWISEFTDTDGLLNIERLCAEVKTVVACPIIIVDYEHQDREGRQMTPTEVCAVDEVMRFYCSL